jgi:hypothetical protein
VSVAGTLAAVDRAIAVLGASADPEAIRVGDALKVWRKSALSLDAALGLPSDWQTRKRVAARDRAIQELVKHSPGMHARGIARKILANLSYCAQLNDRPDGWLGHVHDLAGERVELSERHLRRLIRGHQRACNGHDGASGS